MFGPLKVRSLGTGVVLRAHKDVSSFGDESMCCSLGLAFKPTQRQPKQTPFGGVNVKPKGTPRPFWGGSNLKKGQPIYWFLCSVLMGKSRRQKDTHHLGGTQKKTAGHSPGHFPILSRDPSLKKTVRSPANTDPVFGKNDG